MSSTRSREPVEVRLITLLCEAEGFSGSPEAWSEGFPFRRIICSSCRMTEWQCLEPIERKFHRVCFARFSILVPEKEKSKKSKVWIIIRLSPGYYK